MSKLDFNDDSEKALVEQVFGNAMESLADEDRQLPQVYSIIYLFCIIYLFFSPISLSSPFFYLCLLAVTQIRGHIAGSSPPSPLQLVP